MVGLKDMAAGQLFSYRNQVCKQPVRARYACRQLPEEGKRSVDVPAFAILSYEQGTLAGRLSRIIHGKQGSVLGVPGGGEVEAALLHPAREILLGELVGRVKY